MAVKIRLKKMGRTHRPFFRVCAMDVRSPRNGRVIEELGTYDPMVPETDARAILNGERINYWLGVGAQPTPKVGTLIKKYGKDGSHLDAQTEAISRLSGRRAASIEQARAAAASVKMPDVTKPSEDEAAAPAEGEAAPAEGRSQARLLLKLQPMVPKLKQPRSQRLKRNRPRKSQLMRNLLLKKRLNSTCVLMF